MTTHTWKQSVSSFLHPRVITMLFFGFSAGIPILLIFSSLSLWLREAGVERAQVTFFSWAALGYSFKFIWAPLVDKLPIPYLTNKFGRRRSWILISQFSIILAIILMAITDPVQGSNQLTIIAIGAVLLGFSSATQDIVIDAYRIESAGEELQAMMSSSYIAGYRIGMIVAGAGALFLASSFGSDIGNYNYLAWRNSYFIMASTMLIGVITTLIIKEPKFNKDNFQTHTTKDYSGFILVFVIAVIGFIGTFYFTKEPANILKDELKDFFYNKHLASLIIETARLSLALFVAFIFTRLTLLTNIVNKKMVKETYLEPVQDFFNRYGKSAAIILLSLIGLYRISDIVLGVISNVFYQDLGFSKIEIASIVKTFGLIMTLAGGFLGGILSNRYGVIKILFVGAVLSSATNLLFMLLANMGYNIPMLYIVISADNLSAGLASAAFIAFLSSLTNMKFTAVQYAIFSSLMTLIPKVFGGYSGTIVDHFGYQTFFLITTVIGIPVLGIIWLADRYLKRN